MSNESEKLFFKKKTYGITLVMRIAHPLRLLLAAAVAAASARAGAVVGGVPLPVGAHAGPPPYAGHVDLGGRASALLRDVPDPAIDPYALVGGGAVGPGLYVLAFESDSGTSLRVYNLSGVGAAAGGTLLREVALAGCRPLDVRCSPAARRCYGVALVHGQLVEFAPLAAQVRCRVAVNITGGWDSIIVGAAALDPAGLVYYPTMGALASISILALDIRAGTVRVVPGGQFANRTEPPYCYDPHFGLIVGSSPYGGLAALNTTDGTVRVLRAAANDGPVATNMDCANGFVVFGVFNMHKLGHPFYLLAFDLYASAEPFHNSAASPEAIAGLAFLFPPTRNHSAAASEPPAW